MNLLTSSVSAPIIPAVDTWLQVVIAVCLLAVTLALVPTLLSLRRVAKRSERLLALVEADLLPLAGRLESLVEELQALGHDVRNEVARVGALTARAQEISQGVGRVVSGLAGLTRAGQLVGMAAGIKTGLDVFFHRLRRNEGDNHG